MKKPDKGIVVDAACSGNLGLSEYRAVDIETGEILFTIELGYATNNIAEFVALAHTILHCYRMKLATTIYSDSTTAITWVRENWVKTSMKKNKSTAKAWDYTNRCIKALTELMVIDEGPFLHIGIDDTKYIEVCRWLTDQWGENPADFGRK